MFFLAAFFFADPLFADPLFADPFFFGPFFGEFVFAEFFALAVFEGVALATAGSARAGFDLGGAVWVDDDEEQPDARSRPRERHQPSVLNMLRA